MKSKLIEHALSILLVAGVFIVLVATEKNREVSHRADRVKGVEPYLQIDSIDFGNPLHVLLFKESLNIFHPDTPAQNDSLLQAIQGFRQEQFTNQAYKTGGEDQALTSARLMTIGIMYLQFILAYVIVMVLSYQAAQGLAVFRFVKMKQQKESYLAELHVELKGRATNGYIIFYVHIALLLLKAFAKGLCYAVLFAPAYVIAYSIRSTVDTSSFVFMILLGIVSNGLLINYSNKFFTFLLAESRKGYVETAIVKNLNSSYLWGTDDGVSYWAMLRLKGLFPSHVFKHIFVNARYQFLPTLKEHGSFLITGLIIIEMALNIQGHLGYELMQTILYKQYDVAMCIILGIFLLIKGTEVAVDTWFHHESRKYDNRSQAENNA